MTDSAPEAGLFLPPPPLKQGGIVDHEKETARLEAESATVAAGGDQEVEVAAAVVDCLRSGRPLELSEEERAIALRLLHYTLDLLRRSEKEADSATPGTTLSPDAVIYRRIAPEGLPLTNPEHLPKVLTTPNRIPKNRREAWVLLSERALQLSLHLRNRNIRPSPPRANGSAVHRQSGFPAPAAGLRGAALAAVKPGAGNAAEIESAVSSPTRLGDISCTQKVPRHAASAV